MGAAFGADDTGRSAKTSESTKDKPTDGATKKPIIDADFLNGPQFKSAAKTQDDIDALLFGSG